MRAVFDIGSNSVRLAVAELDGGKLREEKEYLAFSRLAEGRAADGTLTDAAIDRTLAAVQSLYPKLPVATQGPGHLLMTATAAVRQAPNAGQLTDQLTSLVQVPVRILSPDEEGYYGYTGATVDAPVSREEAIVLDIGGGSTELSFYHEGRFHSQSFPYGCLVLKDRPEAIKAFAAALNQYLATVDLKGRTCIGVGGTLTTLAGIVLGLAAYDGQAIHQAAIKRLDWLRFMSAYAGMTAEERAAIPTLAPERRDTILPGLLILDLVCKALGLEGYLASTKDSLQGLLLSDLYEESGQERHV